LNWSLALRAEGGGKEAGQKFSPNKERERCIACGKKAPPWGLLPERVGKYISTKREV